MEQIKNALAGGTMIVLFMLLWFPGGTFWQWAACGYRRLDGWDWVLSAIIPGYGFVKGLTCL